MEERNLNEEESLELISLMIRNARTNLRSRINSNILLMWGYVTVVIAIIVWIAKLNSCPTYYFSLWLIIPLTCYPVSKHFSSQEKTFVRSYLDRVVDYISILYIVVCTTVAIASIWTAFPVFFIEGLLISMWIVTIGLLIKYKFVVVGGALCIVISHIILFLQDTNYHIPVFILIIICSVIIPGHLFKAAISKK